MYRIVSVSKQNHDAFIRSCSAPSFEQTSEFAAFKEEMGWHCAFLDVAEGEELVLASVLYMKRLPFLGSLIYINHGPCVRDVSALRPELLDFYCRALKKYAREQGAFSIMMIPDWEDAALSEELRSCLHRHQFRRNDKNFYSTDPSVNVWPVCHAVCDLRGSEEDVFKRLPARTRTSIRRAEDFGLVCEEVGLEGVDAFDRLMGITAERDGFSRRGKTYFAGLLKALPEAKLFLVKLQPAKTRAICERKLAEQEKKAERLRTKLHRATVQESAPLPTATHVSPQESNRAPQTPFPVSGKAELDNLERAVAKLRDQIAELSALEQQQPDGVWLSGAIYVPCGTCAHYLYGASSNQLRDLLPNYLMQWQMIRCALRAGVTSYNLGGIGRYPGTERDVWPGLWDFKRRLGAEVKTSVGQFDVPVVGWKHHLFRLALKLKSWLKFLHR